MNTTPDAPALIEIAGELFTSLCRSNDFLGGLLIGLGHQSDQFECVLSSNTALSPFNGGERMAVRDVLIECKSKNPNPHIHNTGSFALCSIAKRYGNWQEGTKRVWYHPYSLLGKNLVFIGFIKPAFQSAPRDMPFPSLEVPLKKITSILVTDREHDSLKKTLAATETFVREVGHDFAGSVQAILAKLNTIKSGSLSGKGLAIKIEEIEKEIWATYTQAEQLGITVDSEYKKRDECQINLVSICSKAIDALLPQADERKIEFNLTSSNNDNRWQIWGDEGAIQVCVTQLLHNAVKYAYGSTRIDIQFAGDNEFVDLTVTNLGHALPKADEADRIWELGFRGEEAKGMHVNGSGVGLYSVRKIVIAHFGSYKSSHNSGKTVFKIALPRKNIIKHKVGVLF